MIQFQQNSELVNPMGGVPRTHWNDKIGPGRSCAFASVSLVDVKTVKKHFDVKLNDVVLAICGGALRSYLRGKDLLPDKSLVAGVPVSTRAEGDTELGNQIDEHDRHARDRRRGSERAAYGDPSVQQQCEGDDGRGQGQEESSRSVRRLRR